MNNKPVHRSVTTVSTAGLILFVLAGCSSKISVTTSDGSNQRTATDQAASPTDSGGTPTVDSTTLPMIKIDAMNLLAASPGTVVEVSGQNFRSGIAVNVNGVVVKLKILSPTMATFVMPGDAGIGLVDVTFEIEDQKIKTLSLVSDSAGDDLPITLIAPELVCNDISFRNAKGQVKTGLRDCTTTALADCTQDGQTDCRATDALRAAKLSNFTDADLRSGVNVAGIAGSLTGAPSACAADGATGCLANNSYRAAATSGLATKVLSTASVAGISGSAPVRPSDCAADGIIGCVTVANFPAVDKINVLQANAAKIRASLSIASVAGTLADCAADGAGPCYVDGTTYKALKPVSVDGAKMLATQTLLGVVGTVVSCASDGSQSCYATGSYKAATACSANSSNCYVPPYALTTQPLKAISYDTISVNAAKIRDSATLGGVTGTLADCATNGASGCVTTVTYKSGDLTNLSAANIKNGVTVAGQLGDYPSATYPLPNSGASGITTDLTTFATQLTTNGNFQFWDSTGSRHTGSGDSDIVNANVKSGVAFENVSVSGSAIIPNVWDVRAGASVGSTTGKLKANCRNGSNSALTDYEFPGQVATVNTGSPGSLTIPSHGLASNTQVRILYSTAPSGVNDYTTYYVIVVDANTIRLSTAAGPGAAANITPSAGVNVTVHRWKVGTLEAWDTLDDYNYGYGTMTTSPWPADNFCGGIDDGSAPTAGNVWKDVTTGTCNGTTCRYKDQISGLEWSKTLPTQMAWGEAVEGCRTLSLDGGGWRLPTQKEMLDAYNHGILSAANANWITETAMTNEFWTATVVSTASGITAWTVYPYTGVARSNTDKRLTFNVACVR